LHLLWAQTWYSFSLKVLIFTVSTIMLLPTTRKVLAEVYVIVVGLVHSAGLKSLLPGTLSAVRQN
jgi:hypothetical protein